MRRRSAEREAEIAPLKEEYDRLVARAAAATRPAEGESRQRHSRAALVAIVGMLLVRGLAAVLARVPGLSAKTVARAGPLP
jgi:hypothetical protein